MVRRWAESLALAVTTGATGCAASKGPAAGTTDGDGSSAETATTGAPTTSAGAGTDATTGESGSTSASASSGASGGSDGSEESSTTTGARPCDPLEHCSEASEDGGCRHELELPDGMRIHYWSNLPLVIAGERSGCHAAIERAIVVQHGNGRNPWSYFANVREAATLARLESQTLVVAPWFPADEDDPPRGFHRWDPGGSGWKSGDDSLTAPPLSSFAVIDHIVSAQLLDAAVFPSLAEIVVTGHSAGGQFAQRYAVATAVDDAAADVAMRFVVLNPSSYLYLDPWRWDGVGEPPGLSFELPTGTGCDDEYDDFKYGLSDLPAGHYVTEHLATIPSAYLARDVVYLLGEADVELDADLDMSCPAQLQGEHRLERGLVFADYLDARFAGHAHALATVPGVGHSNGDMYTSPVGIAVLFGS
jgi:pimeloyl-ACP methyl ester carboxylesterase